jgi:hypothetical protein
VVIQIVNVKRVGVGQAKYHPPICANRYRPKSFELTFERMQPKAGHIHIGHTPGRVEPRENIAQLNDVFGNNAAWVVAFMKALQSSVTYRPDHPAP